MSYCLNPNCSVPENIDSIQFCPSCGTSLSLGDRYRSLKLIGQGGFGRTFLACDRHKPSHPLCIIKQFHPQEKIEIDKAAQLFQQEAIRLEELGDNPQIPNLYAYIEQEENQYIVQEFIDGETLQVELEKNGNFTAKQILEILENILPVLEFVHQGRVIHRDIKPSNIMRCSDNKNLILIDFGAAKYATNTALIQKGTQIGSAEFIAPEQLRRQPIFASDLYSLGVTCLYLLTGISPFDLYNTLESRWVWRDYLVDNAVGDRLGKILDKMIAESLSDRYGTATEILQDLNSSSPTFPQISSSQKSPKSSVKRENTYTHAYNLTQHSDKVLDLAISPDSQYLATASEDKTIKLWELATGEEVQTLQNKAGEESAFHSVTFSPNGKVLASGDFNNVIQLWKVKNGKKIRQLKGHGGFVAGVNSLAFSWDGEILASVGGDKTLRIWEVKSGKCLHILRSHSRWLSSVSMSPDRQTLVTASADQTIKIWDFHAGTELKTIKNDAALFAGFNAVTFSPDGKIIATASDDYTVKLWDAIAGSKIGVLENHNNWVCSVDFRSDGLFLASGGYDKAIRIWDMRSQEEYQVLEGHQNTVRVVLFSPDGTRLVSGSEDKMVKIWQL
ncbi:MULTISPECIES: serine/threonine-protein kinase [Spirulina sp. CCY15215]|uniref:serine/threonine-protein kinase n=1 Tax=Spirulina sp. CCY15215 TaxID=2767591 RepID=UPI00194E47CA|nr:serine/threonine-protein kinase [Spirulina major]